MSDTIDVTVNASALQPGAGTKSVLGGIVPSGAVAVATVIKPIETGVLKANLARLTDGLSLVFADLRAVGDMKLDEVEVGLEISAEGGVSLVGTATVGAAASITLKFTRG